MASITTRAGKGSPLTNSELDANFNNINAGITTTAAVTGGTINGTTIGATTPATGIFTQVTVDNIDINGNTISSLNANGNISLTPNGTGAVAISGVINEAQGSNITSASTINLTTATGNYIHITGTTAITAITLAQGAERTIVFDGALTFTNGANLILPSGMDIITEAGDTAVVRGEAAGVVRCVGYTRANGTAVRGGFVNVKDYGAVGDGVTNDTTAIFNAVTYANIDDKVLLIPKGNYLYNGTVYTVDGDSFWYDSGSTLPVNLPSQAQHNCILLTADTQNVSPLDIKYSKIPLSVTVRAYGAQHASGVRSNLVNYSTDGNGCTAFYGRASSTGITTNWSAAVHGETRHAGGTSIGINSENASYETTGTLIGLSVLNSTDGAETTHPQTGGAKTVCTNAYGIYILGSNDATNTKPESSWLYGLYLGTGGMREGGTSVYLAPLTTVDSHLKTSVASPATTADILLQGQSGYGLICNSVYKNGAIRVNNDQFILLNASGGTGFKLDTAAGTSRVSFRGGISNITGTAQAGGASTITLAAGASSTTNDPTYVGHTLAITSGTGVGQQRTISSYDGTTKVATMTAAWSTIPNATSAYTIRISTERVGFTVNATPTLHLNSTQVVGTRNTGWTVMTGTTNKNTSYDTSTVTLAQLAGRVMALQEALTTHGLIGA